MIDDTDKKNALITIKSEVKRLDDTVTHLESDQDKTEEFFKRELQHITDKIKALFKKLGKAEDRIENVKPHECLSKDRIDDLHEEIMESNRSIKRLYIWQAGIGIGLLIAFLSFGVTSLALVNKMDFGVQRNAENIQKIQQKLEKQEEAERDELKQTIREALRDSTK